MGDDKLEWMYKNASTVDPEEYLLGRAVDKNIESHTSNEIDKDILPTSIFANSTSNIQVDVFRKIKEDPLEKIKQKEIEMRKQLLKNPVKLKKLQNMLKAKSDKIMEKDHKKKKKSKEDLDSILAEKYSKLLKKYGAKNLVELTKSGNESSEDEKFTKKKKRKHERRRKEDSSSSSSGSSNEEQAAVQSRSKGKEENFVKESSKRVKSHFSGEDGQISRESDRRNVGKNHDRKSRHDSKPLTSSRKSSHANSRHKRRSSSRSSSTEDESHNQMRHQKVVGTGSDSRREQKTRDDSSSEKETFGLKKAYGLVMLKGDAREVGTKKQAASVRETKRKVEPEPRSKHKRPAQTKLSEEEKAKRLKEMMANGEWRDKDRKNRVTQYREDQRKEDAKEKKYDGDFLRNQLAKASSKSIEERIKSKMNHLQRSKSSMDQSFTRK